MATKKTKKKAKAPATRKPKKPAAARAATKKSARAKAVAKPKPKLKPKPKAKAGAKKQPKKSVAASPRKRPVKKAAPPKKKAAAPRAKPLRRRDGAGHLDPKYAAELLEKSGQRAEAEERTAAFLDRPRTTDDLAEELAETAVATMTSGEDEAEENLNQTVLEEVGGPFVPSTAGQEFAEGTDASNPKDAEPEPFPKT